MYDLSEIENLNEKDISQLYEDTVEIAECYCKTKNNMASSTCSGGTGFGGGVCVACYHLQAADDISCRNECNSRCGYGTINGASDWVNPPYEWLRCNSLLEQRGGEYGCVYGL